MNQVTIEGRYWTSVSGTAILNKSCLCASMLAILSSFGLPTSIAKAEQNVVVVIDDSGSMDDRMQTANGRKRRIAVAKDALASVLTKMPPETKVGVLALNTENNGSNWIIPFGTGTPDGWVQNIRSLRADGGTPLGEYMKVGADQLLEVRKKKAYGTYRLLIVTDGEANDQWLVDGFLPDILSRGIVLDVIGVDMEGDHSLATKVHNYRRADDAASLERALSEVFAETSSDDQDAADDFELLAALPDGFAEQAILALASPGNEPIQGDDSARGGVQMSLSTGTSASAAGAFGGLFCCFVSLGFVVLVAILIKAGRPKRR